MPTPASPPSGATPASVKRGRFVLFCIWSLLVFGGGAYLGSSATKNAINGPEWLRRLLGVNAPPQIAANNGPGPNMPGGPQPGNNMAPGGQMPNTSPSGPPPNTGAPTGGSPVSSPPPAEPGFWGSWTTEEDVVGDNNTPKKVTYLYTFSKDGSGEFSVDGQKTADIKWEGTGDTLDLTFTTGNGSAGRFWRIKEKWFTNPEKTLLTFVPQGAQDATAEMGTGGTKILKRK